MGRYFGTDGIRAEAASEVFSPPFLGRLARALVAFLAEAREVSAPSIVLGRDPRHSGAAVVETLAAELSAAGAGVLDAGIVPTPAVARTVLARGADLGIVITASHNPAADNGIKLFTAGGTKFSAAEEAAIESRLEAMAPLPPAPRVTAERIDAAGAYVDFAAGLLPPGALQGWRIAVDCAHGATAATTPAVLRRLGAEVQAIGVEPDGVNINDGVGSEHPERLAELVRRTGARLGLAHDGDGDRLVLVDAAGAIVPGDAVLGLLGQALARAGRLAGQTVVATVMSNLGLDRALAAVGGRVVRTPVGDRQVYYQMLEGGYDFGGESSGHLIFRPFLPTGDGLVAALLVLEAMLSSGEDLATLAGRIPLFPQQLTNRRVREKIPLETLPGLAAALAELSGRLGERGRILVRYSGTEPKIRLLAEAESEALLAETMAELERLVGRDLELL